MMMMNQPLLSSLAPTFLLALGAELRLPSEGMTLWPISVKPDDA